MTGILQHIMRILFQSLNISFSDRTVKHSCLAETTPTDTSSLDLKNNSVLRYFDKRNNRFHRIRCICYIHNNLLLNYSRCIFIIRCK